MADFYREEVWVCNNCGTINDDYPEQAYCSECNGTSFTKEKLWFSYDDEEVAFKTLKDAIEFKKSKNIEWGDKNGMVVQSVERRSPKPDVVGSNPTHPISNYGNMKKGMMCLNCGYLTDASDMFWGWVYEFREDDVPLVHLICPICHHINSNEVVTYMIVEKRVEKNG